MEDDQLRKRNLSPSGSDEDAGSTGGPKQKIPPEEQASQAPLFLGTDLETGEEEDSPLKERDVGEDLEEEESPDK
jgi:hypothetical protein